MVGCVILLFCKKKILAQIKDLYFCKVEAGMAGFAKNKGSVACRFRLHDTTFAFLNCHLQHGGG